MTAAQVRHLRGKRVVVTGGAGFIGSHLVDRLIAEDVADITVIDDYFLGKQTNLKLAQERRPELRVLKMDASDISEMRSAFAGLEPVDVVFDLAVIPLPTSLEQPKWCFDTNVRITSTLCELLREGRFETLAHFSSSEAYGSARQAPMGEEHPLEPLTPYAASKAAGDHLVRTYAATFEVDALVVRPFNNYGPRQNDQQYAGIIPTLLNCAYTGTPFKMFGDGLQTRDYIYVTDTVRAVVDLYGSPQARGQVINIGSGQEISMRALVEKIEAILGRPLVVEYHPPRPGDVRRHLADITRLKSLVEFEPEVGIDEGLARTVAFYQESYASRGQRTLPGE